MDAAVRAGPGAPLSSVHGPQLPLGVRPLVPDVDAGGLERAHVRLPAQEPEQLVHDGLRVQLLGREQGEPRLEVEAHLPAEDAAGARSRCGPGCRTRGSGCGGTGRGTASCRLSRRPPRPERELQELVHHGGEEEQRRQPRPLSQRKRDALNTSRTRDVHHGEKQDGGYGHGVLHPAVAEHADGEQGGPLRPVRVRARRAGSRRA